MEDLEARELRYFVTVAELLHFGRAAAQLHIAQPALSKTIQRIESRLGADLFVRTSRRVSLTIAGKVLLEHGRHALNAIDMAVQRAREAGEHEHLRLVMKPGGDAGLLSGLLAGYAQQPGAKQVDIRFCGGTDRSRMLRDGRADLALLYAPFDDLTGLHVTTLYVEDRVAILPSAHPLAGRESISLADLTGETLPRWSGVPTDQTTGPSITDVAELIPLVTIGRAVAVLPRSLVSPTPPGTACVSVRDAGPSSIVLARTTEDTRRDVSDFIKSAEAISGIASAALPV